MQIVISVTDLQRKWIENYGFIPDDLNVKMAEVILNGTVLPEHGRLIDADDIDSITIIQNNHTGALVRVDAPTILDATGVSE